MKKLALRPGATVVGLVGNPRPLSRTHRAVSAVAAAMAQAVQGHVDDVIDLADHRGVLFEFGSSALAHVLERVLRADVLVVGSPTYKATYTGLLKSFCDHIGGGQLAGTFAVPLMMGGSEAHSLAVDHGLRPLLVELGATCATPGLWVVESRVDEIETIATDYVARMLSGINIEKGVPHVGN